MVKLRRGFLTALALVCLLTHGCAAPAGDPELTRHTRLELIDWHISGLMIVNCPVAWVKVYNYNRVPIKEITFQYNSYDESGHPMDEGTYTIDGRVNPGEVKNFIELYIGLVNLHTEALSVKLLSVVKG